MEKIFRREISMGRDGDDGGVVRLPVVVATSSVVEDNEKEEDDHDNGSLGPIRWTLRLWFGFTLMLPVMKLSTVFVDRVKVVMTAADSNAR